MKKVLLMVSIGMLAAIAASAATVPASLKSKVASDDQLTAIRGGKPSILPTQIAVPIAKYNGDGTWQVYGWFYVNPVKGGTPPVTHHFDTSAAGSVAGPSDMTTAQYIKACTQITH